MEVGVQRHALVGLPPRNTWYPLYGRLSGPQGRSGRVRKISPPPGFDSQTVQPVASRYTDCAIASLTFQYRQRIFLGLGLLRQDDTTGVSIEDEDIPASKSRK